MGSSSREPDVKWKDPPAEYVRAQRQYADLMVGDVEHQYEHQTADMQQQMISRGLSQTTVPQSMRMEMGRGRERTIGDIEHQYQQQIAPTPIVQQPEASPWGEIAGLAGGIVGGVAGAYAGNPMLGYTIGSGVGRGAYALAG